ncbi:hypothetical protein QUB10_32865 [Microcoleus sp. B5-D4]|uniref:hypothetical protein n=1 Tax=unclassified Microcoleus TaxID=2642155 RepID=UPI002FD62098
MQLTLNSDFTNEWGGFPGAEYQPLLDFEEETLNAVPYNDLADLTREIKLSFVDYVRQGVMLAAIRRNRLYKRQFKDFAEYCKLALGRSPIYCKRIIEAAQTTIELIKAGFEILPTSVSQALPLVKFTKPDDAGNRELETKWQAVLDSQPPDRITAAAIAEAIDDKEPEERPKQVKIGGKAFEMLQKKALAVGLSISKYLEMLISGDDFPSEEPPDGEPETELTPEKVEVCDRAEAFAKSKLAAGFCKKKLSTSPQQTIAAPIRSGCTSDSS